MCRTFRCTNIKPSVYKCTDYKGEVSGNIYLKCKKSNRGWIHIESIQTDFYELYRDKQRCSYKFYRKYEEQQFKTYCKHFVRDSLKNNEDGALKPVTRACSGYWG